MVKVCNICLRQFTNARGLKTHMGIQHDMNGTQRGKRSKRSNEHMPSTNLLDGDIGSDDGEMGNSVASVDAFQHCTSAPRTEHVRTHTVDEDGERVLPPQEGDSIRYLHLTSSNVNPGDDRTDENAGDLENLMLLFVDMVNKHFISFAVAESILRWASLIRGNTGLLLPKSYRTIMKRVSELHTRQQAAENNAMEQQHNPAVALPSFSYYNCVTIPVPPEYNNNCSTVTFEFSDILSVAASIMEDPNVVSGEEDFELKHHKPRNEKEQRLWTPSIPSGNLWRRTEVRENIEHRDDAALLAVVPFLDKTNITKNGGRTGYPLIITLGNLQYHVRQMQAAQRIVAYIPLLASKALKKTQGFKDAQNKLRVTCLDLVFRSMRAVYESAAGGIYLRLFGRTIFFIPFIPFIVQDSQEGNKICFCSGSCLSYFPCRQCWVRREFLADTNPEVISQPRLQHQVVNFLTEQANIIEAGVHGTVTAAREAAKQISMHPIVNPMWFLYFGDSDRGVHGGTPPEIMHQFDLGMMKTSFGWTWDTVLESDPRRKGELNHRYVLFNCRHSDASIFTKHYSEGTFELKQTEAKEYVGLLFQTIVAIGTTNKFIFDEPTRKRVQKALALLILVRNILWDEDGHTSDDISNLKYNYIPKLLNAVITAFTGKSASEFEIYKVHATHHLTEVIEEFGSLRSVDSGAGESYNRIVKKSFQRTSRRKSSQNKEMFTRALKASAHEKEVHDRGLSEVLRVKKRYITRSADSFVGDGQLFNLYEDAEPEILAAQKLLLPQGYDTDFCVHKIQRLICAFARSMWTPELAAHGFKANFHNTLKVNAGGDTSVIYHAKPPRDRAERGTGWYDSVIFNVDLVDPTTNEVVGSEYRAGLLIAFVCITDTLEKDDLSKKEDILAAIIHPYKTLTGNVYNVEDPVRAMCDNESMPFSYMKLPMFRNGPELDIIDTDYISSAVWTQKDFDRDDAYWLLRYWYNRDKQIEKLLL